MSRAQRSSRVGAMAVLALVLAGCGGGSHEAPPSTTPAVGATTTTPSPAPSSTVATGREQTYHGRIGDSGLTCVAFTARDGTKYALSGRGVTDRIVKLAHSGIYRKSPRAKPSPPKIATVTVVGHEEPHAMNTCGYRTLIVSKVVVVSVRTATGLPPARA